MEIDLKPVGKPFLGKPSITLDYPTVNFERHATVHIAPVLTGLPESLKKVLQPFQDTHGNTEPIFPYLWITTYLSGTSVSDYKGTMSVKDASDSSGILKTLSENFNGQVKLNVEMLFESVRRRADCDDMTAGSEVLMDKNDRGWYWGIKEAMVAAIEPQSGKYGCKKTVDFIPHWLREDPEFSYDNFKTFYDYDSTIDEWSQYWKSRWHSYSGDISITAILPN